MDFTKDYLYGMSIAEAKQYNLGLTRLGTSAPPFEKQTKALRARVHEGLSNVELGFSGAGKGSLQGHQITPGMHSKEEREDMRQLAKVNEIELTTHANIGSLGVSGFDNREGFKDAVREKTLQEIQRAIDFAADVAGGGPIVFHLGEFQRPVYGIEGDERFEMYPREKEERSYPLVNSKTGQIIMAIREDQEIYMPEPELDKDKNPVPKLGADGKPLTYKDLVTSEEKVIYRNAVDPEGNIIAKKKTFPEYYKEKIEEINKLGEKAKYSERDIPKMFYSEFMRADIEQNSGQADEYEMHYKRNKEDAEQLQKEIKIVEEMEKNISEEELDKLREEQVSRYTRMFGLAPNKKLKPSEILKEELWQVNKQMAYGMETATAGRKRIAQTEDQIRYIEPAEKFVLEKSGDSLARMGIYCMEKEKKMKEEGIYKKPLFVAPENFFPEFYGSHPDEYKRIIQNARKAMAKKLVEERKVPKDRADELAEHHIKATFDIGHAHTWRKYFKGSDEDYNKWVINKAKELIKDGIIGHVHLTDNFGYEDEHLAPGEGTAPIAAFVKEMRKGGYKGPMILEPGAQERQIDMLRGAMRSFNSPVYRIDGASVSWSDIDNGYFGKTRGPTYIVGAYAPDIGLPTEHRSWTFWSGVPLE